MACRMKLFLAGTLSILAFSAMAQLDIAGNERIFLEKKQLYLRQGENKGLVGITANYHVNSGSIDNSFLKQALYGGYIDEETKQSTFGNLKTKNRAGLMFNGGLVGAVRKDSYTIVAGITHNEYFSAVNKPDFFKLIFSGNKQFEDKHANLSNTSIQYFNYQGLTVGLHKQLEGKNIILGGGLSIIRGGSLQSLSMKRGDFYTAPGGHYIDFDTDISLSFSNSDKRAIPRSNGIGAGIDLSLSAFTEKSTFNFEIKDLGFISWSNINNYQGSGLYRFDGIKVKDIFQVNDSVFTGLNADSISAQLGLAKNRKKVNTALPSQFGANYTYYFSPKFTLATGVKYVLSPAYVPRVYIKPIYNVSEGFSIIPTVAYGGFGGLDFELGVVKNFNDKLLISANLFYLEYLIAPTSSSGHGFNVSLFKTF